MKLAMKYKQIAARGMGRMAAGIAALLFLTYWALNLQILGPASQIDGSLVGLAVGSLLSGWLVLSGSRAYSRASNGNREPVSSHMAAAPAIQRTA
jgi:hypothetical protein